jgi:hypothetical protein
LELGNNFALGKFKDISTSLGIAQLHTTSNLTRQHNISFSIVDNLTPYLNMHAKFKIETCIFFLLSLLMDRPGSVTSGVLFHP